MDEKTTTDQQDQLTQWLNRAWLYCPTAHYLFVTELLRYGSALSCNHPQDEIATCHVNCKIAIIAHCTKQLLAEELDCVSADCEVDAETKALVKWLYVLRPGADMQLLSSLLRLSVLNQRSLLFSRTGEHHDALVASYKRQKAEIVSQAYIKYGAELLQSDSSSLVSMMLREEKRFQK